MVVEYRGFGWERSLAEPKGGGGMFEVVWGEMWRGDNRGWCWHAREVRC